MKAIIFDLDGTLLDVSESIFWQYETLTRECNGVQASREAIAAALKSSPEDSMRRLITNFRVPMEQVHRRHRDLHEASLQHLRLYPQADELLPMLQRLGVRIGVIAIDNRDTIRHLDRLGVTPYVHTLIPVDRVAHQEHADQARALAVRLALRDLDVLPHEAMLVGDTAADIIAGKQAALHGTIGITHGFGELHDLHQAGADHVVHDIPSVLDVLG